MRDIDTKEIYKNCRAVTGMNQNRWGRLFTLGNSKNVRQTVTRKEKASEDNNSTRVSHIEAAHAQNCAFLYKIGYDIDNIEYDDQGVLIDIPKFETDANGEFIRPPRQEE